MGPPASYQSRATPTSRASFDKHSLRPALKRKSINGGGSALLGAAREVEQQIIEPAKPDMATSFLQFCAMCEKQITTPCNSILYCSEACRRKDGCKPLSAATLSEITPPPSIPSSPKFSLPSRVPTSSYIDQSSSRIPATLHDHKSDLDPTEWKPKLSYSNRAQSDAYRYLTQFHLRHSNEDSHDTIPTMAAVPATGSTTPSLAGTPATSASSTSISTNMLEGIGERQALHAYVSEAGVYGDTSHQTGRYGSYDPSMRPLPLRHNRWYSFSGATPRGTDLVTPHIVPSVSNHDSSTSSKHLTETGQSLWDKKVVIGSAPDTSGMGALFGKQGP